MTFSNPAPTQEKIVTDGSPKVDHVYCGVCFPNGAPAVMLCGTPMQPGWEIVGPGSAIELEPCVVCFAADALVCTGCGLEISTCP